MGKPRSRIRQRMPYSNTEKRGGETRWPLSLKHWMFSLWNHLAQISNTVTKGSFVNSHPTLARQLFVSDQQWKYYVPTACIRIRTIAVCHVLGYILLGNKSKLGTLVVDQASGARGCPPVIGGHNPAESTRDQGTKIYHPGTLESPGTKVLIRCSSITCHGCVPASDW